MTTIKSVSDYLQTVKHAFSERSAKQLAARAKKLFMKDRIEEALQLAEKALLIYPNSVALWDIKVAMLKEIKAYDGALHPLKVALTRRINKLRKQGYAFDCANEYLGRRGRVFISGFFYSGSGAVLDYLRGFTGAEKFPFVKGECRVVKFPGGIADIGSTVAKKGELDAKSLIRFYLHLVGKQVVYSGRGIYHKDRVVNRNSRRLVKDAKSRGYVFQALRLLEEYWGLHEKGAVTIEEIETISSRGLRRMLDAAAMQNNLQYLLVDQIVTAWRIEIARYVPPSSFIVVHRDPRDQFSEVKVALGRPGRKQWTAGEYVEIYRSWRKLVDTQIPIMETRYGHRFLRVCFEDFVRAHDVESKRILDYLGLSASSLVEKRFFPEVSIKNVGKYKVLLTPEEISTLEKGLPEYLSSP